MERSWEVVPPALSLRGCHWRFLPLRARDWPRLWCRCLTCDYRNIPLLDAAPNTKNDFLTRHLPEDKSLKLPGVDYPFAVQCNDYVFRYDSCGGCRSGRFGVGHDDAAVGL